jgi:hypothetical protein
MPQSAFSCGQWRHDPGDPRARLLTGEALDFKIPASLDGHSPSRRPYPEDSATMMASPRLTPRWVRAGVLLIDQEYLPAARPAHLRADALRFRPPRASGSRISTRRDPPARLAAAATASGSSIAWECR